jgi:hypothetical protein
MNTLLSTTFSSQKVFFFLRLLTHTQLSLWQPRIYTHVQFLSCFIILLELSCSDFSTYQSLYFIKHSYILMLNISFLKNNFQLTGIIYYLWFKMKTLHVSENLQISSIHPFYQQPITTFSFKTVRKKIFWCLVINILRVPLSLPSFLLMASFLPYD